MKELESMIKRSDFIFHLAGENRPDNPIKFSKNNTQLTKDICKLASENNPFPSVSLHQLKHYYITTMVLLS